MRDLRWLRLIGVAGLIGSSLGGSLACGKYGPPVRNSSVATPTESESVPAAGEGDAGLRIVEENENSGEDPETGR